MDKYYLADELLHNTLSANQEEEHTSDKRESVVLQWNLADNSFKSSSQWGKYMLDSISPASLLNPEICIKGIHSDDCSSFFDFCKKCKEEFNAVALLHLLLQNSKYQLALVSAAIALGSDNSPEYVVVTIVEIEENFKTIYSDPHIKFPIDAGSGMLIYEVKDRKPHILFTSKPLELQIAMALRDAHPLNAIFLAAYDLESDEVLHFAGEVLSDKVSDKEKFADIKAYYLECVHENDIKKIVYNELRLHDASINDLSKEEIVLEGRIIPPSSNTKEYIWVEITFIKFTEESGRRICCVLARDISAQKTEKKELRRMANLDPYSTILPRMAFEEFCASQRKNRVIASWMNAVLLIDFSVVTGKSLEGIEHVDLLDMISRKSEPVITRHINEKTFAARFSDTIFLMSIHDLANVNALREWVFNLQDELIKAVNNKDLAVCIGVALCHHDKEIGFRCVYDDVEKALKMAKKSNRNQVVFYKLGLNEDSSEESANSVFIRTFSNFEVFVNDKPINFKYKKAKELLAVLVDRRGGFVTNTEAAGLLWEDEPITKQVRARFRKVAMWLNNTLAEYGIGDIIETEGRARRLCTDRVTCDLYNYLSHKEKYAETYGGFYMNEYSWAEFTTAELNKEMFIE